MTFSPKRWLDRCDPLRLICWSVVILAMTIYASIFLWITMAHK